MYLKRDNKFKKKLNDKIFTLQNKFSYLFGTSICGKYSLFFFELNFPCLNTRPTKCGKIGSHKLTSNPTNPTDKALNRKAILTKFKAIFFTSSVKRAKRSHETIESEHQERKHYFLLQRIELAIYLRILYSVSDASFTYNTSRLLPVYI